MIKVDSFRKVYESTVAVDELSFCVQPGEILGLVGRNGAGKTTTLKSIAGIIPPTAGSLSVNEFEVGTDPISVKQHSAYVPDDPELFNELTVDQHILLSAGIYGIRDPQPETERLLDTFELTSRRNVRASGLSRGMKQKLAIICALIQRPTALLLDEPMTGLDPQGIRMLKKTILRQAESGTAVIISSHLLAMVEDICSHVMIIDSGKKRFNGPINELKQQFGSDRNENRTLEEIYFEAVSMSPLNDRVADAPDDSVPASTH